MFAADGPMKWGQKEEKSEQLSEPKRKKKGDCSESMPETSVVAQRAWWKQHSND